MAKVKKSENNNSQNIINNITYSFSSSNNSPIIKNNVNKNSSTQSYTYVIKDLWQTFFISIFLFVLEVVIFILLKNNVFKIPSI